MNTWRSMLDLCDLIEAYVDVRLNGSDPVLAKGYELGHQDAHYPVPCTERMAFVMQAQDYLLDIQ